MKKQLLLLLLLTSSFISLAQIPEKIRPYTFGFKAGMNMHRYVFVQKESANVVSRSTIGYQMSGFFDTPLNELVSFQPGLALVQKGGDFTGNNKIPVKHNLIWLQVPVHLVGKIPVKKGNYFLGAGLFAGFALTGTKTVINENQTQKNNIVFGYDLSDDSEYDDFGVSFTGGFRLKKGTTIQLGYEQGLTDLRPDGLSIDGKRTTRVYSLSVGYSFYR